MNAPLPPPRRLPWLQIVTVLGFVLLAVVFFVPRLPVADMVESLRVLGPLPFYLVFAVLTLAGFPSTPFFVIGGAAFPLWQNMIFATLGMLLHFLLAHALAARWLRESIRRVLLRRGLEPPAVAPGNEWKVALMIKFAPGVPMFLKSYLMGVAGIPLKVFLVVSLPATWIYALALLTLGKSAMQGSLGWFLGGLALLVFAAALWRYIKSRGQRS